MGGDGIDGEALALEGHFDAREMVEVADGERRGDVVVGEEAGAVLCGMCGVDAVGVEDDGGVRDAGLKCEEAHGLDLVNDVRGVAGAAGEDEYRGEPLVVEGYAGGDAVMEGMGRDIAGPDSGAQDDYGVRGAAIVGEAEGEHLGEGEERGDGCEGQGHEREADEPVARKPVGPGIGSEHSPGEESQQTNDSD